MNKHIFTFTTLLSVAIAISVYKPIISMEYKEGFTKQDQIQQLQDEYDSLSQQFENLKTESFAKTREIQHLAIPQGSKSAMLAKFMKDSIKEPAQNLLDAIQQKLTIAQELNNEDLVHYLSELSENVQEFFGPLLYVD